MNTGLTVESFLDFFRKTHGWKCEEGTKITSELSGFAKEREGSKRDIDELYIIFCISKGIKPYPNAL